MTGFKKDDVPRYEITDRLFLQDNITDVLVPSGQRRCQLCIKLACAGAVRRALPDLQVD